MFDLLHDPSPVLGDERQLAAVVRLAERRRRRHARAATGAVSGVLVVAGVAALGVRSPGSSGGGHAPAATTGSTTAPPATRPTVTEPASVGPVVTAPAPSGAPSTTTTAPASASPGVAPGFAEIAGLAERRARQIGSISFRFDDPGDPGNAATTWSVVLGADGTIWATGNAGAWAYYDPSTGLGEMARADATGTLVYQQVHGPDGAWNQLAAISGGVLFTDLGSLPGDLTVEEAEHDGRPAWLVVQRNTQLLPAEGHRVDPASLPGTVPTVEVDVESRYWVDQETGLAVRTDAANGWQTDEPGNWTAVRSDIAVHGLAVGTPIPDEPPGRIPDGVEPVGGGGDPATVGAQLSFEQLAAAFGTGVPRPAIEGATYELALVPFANVTSIDPIVVEGEPSFAPGDVSFRYVVHQGFDRREVTIGSHRYAPDFLTGDHASGVLVETGLFAGAELYAFPGGILADTHGEFGPLSVSVLGTDLAQALADINSIEMTGS